MMQNEANSRFRRVGQGLGDVRREASARNEPNLPRQAQMVKWIT
jgi:hypothetical protein